MGRGGDTTNPHHAGTISPDTLATDNPHCGDTTSPVTSGRVSPTISHRVTSIITSAGPSTRQHTFVLGEQVYITNCITHLVTPGPLDQAAIVTRVQSRQIDFRTLSGDKTWCSPGNLRRLTEQEITSHNHLLNSGS